MKLDNFAMSKSFIKVNYETLIVQFHCLMPTMEFCKFDPFREKNFFD